MTNAGAQASIGTALLASQDAVAIGQITECLKELAMSVESCAEAHSVLNLLNQRKFEAVMVDMRLGGEVTTIIEQARSSPANRTAVAFAIAGGDQAASAFKSGANFIFQTPLNPESVSQTLKVAFGLIVRERRRNFRCPICVPVTIQRKGAWPEVLGSTVNISENGLALTAPVPLMAGVQGTVRFTLPAFNSPLEAEAKVCWSNPKGQAGLFFLSVTPDRSELQAWLARQLEQHLPESVAKKFRQSSGEIPK